MSTVVWTDVAPRDGLQNISEVVPTDAKVRLVRDGTVVYDGEIASLRRFNEDAREVAAGFDCGIVLRDYADVKDGDVIEAYATRQVERELA